MKLARRLESIEPFYVMECAKAAQALARGPRCDPAQGGRRMIFLNLGEPDFPAPAPVLDAARRALDAGRAPYTAATGLPALRQALSRWYGQAHGLDVSPDRIVITAGASAALQLVCLALLQAGDEVLMPDPSYPCNRHFVAAADARAVLLPTTAGSRFQPDAASIDAAWTPVTRGVLLASPSNPTGTSVPPAEMARIVETVRARGGFTIVDEIYLGLSYDDTFGQTALRLGEDVISVNSFSKYFSMTGWRLGWLVLPPALVEPVERLAQNLFICPSSIAQQAALAAFEVDSLAQCEQRRREFQRRRDWVVPALGRIGLPVPVMPDGAFYAWADCSAVAGRGGSWDFAFRMMEQAQVALTPGRDFGRHDNARFVRLSFASALEDLHEAVDRLGAAIAAGR